MSRGKRCVIDAGEQTTSQEIAQRRHRSATRAGSRATWLEARGVKIISRQGPFRTYEPVIKMYNPALAAAVTFDRKESDEFIEKMGALKRKHTTTTN
jgi:hypothetical protein